MLNVRARVCLLCVCVRVCKLQSEFGDVRVGRWVCLFLLCALWAEPRLSLHDCKAEHACREERKKRARSLMLKWNVISALSAWVRACACVFMCLGICSVCVMGTCNVQLLSLSVALARWTENADGRTVLSWHKQSLCRCFAQPNMCTSTLNLVLMLCDCKCYSWQAGGRTHVLQE